MSNFIVFNENGKFLRTGNCPARMVNKQAGNSEFVMEGIGNDRIDKIKFDGLDAKNKPINPRIVKKTEAEIEHDNPTPTPIPEDDKLAHITNKQWRNMQDRITQLENN